MNKTPLSSAGTRRIHLNRPIVLVGLMGAGKTSVGKRLAAMLGVPFTDSDHEIVEAAGMSIPRSLRTWENQRFATASDV